MTGASARTVLTVAVVLASFAAVAAAAEITETVRLDSSELELVNMIGEVVIEPAAGDEFLAEITIRGEDAEAGLVEIVVDEGREGRIFLKFPVEDHQDYVYPELGRKSKSSFTIGEDEDGSWWDKFRRAIGGEKVTVRGSGRGLEVWADVVLKVPEGSEAEVKVFVGTIDAAEVTAALSLDTSSGSITVRDQHGDLVCDTGSGGVEIEGVEGEVLVDTGSGGVRVTDHQGDELKVDTGSGGVRIDGCRTGHLFVDTGSGGVRAHRVETDSARIDTGSGAVVLELDRMGDGKFVIDTGSGGVELRLPRDASADISVDVGSGHIDCDFPGAEIVHKERDEMRVRIGGGAARVIIDTGSGGVDIASTTH